MLEQIVKCIEAEKYLYSKHARDEMEAEEFGEIRDEEADEEAVEAILNGKIIEIIRKMYLIRVVSYMEKPPREDLSTLSVPMQRILKGL